MISASDTAVVVTEKFAFLAVTKVPSPACTEQANAGHFLEAASCCCDSGAAAAAAAIDIVIVAIVVL